MEKFARFSNSMRLLVVTILLASSKLATAEWLQLTFPVDCEIGGTCEIQNYVDADATSRVRDYKCGTRTYNGHNGTDIRLPSHKMMYQGVNVLAAAKGRVLRLRDDQPDISVKELGRTAITKRECGNGVVLDHANGWQTQYCHLRRGSVAVKVGEILQAGQVIGQIGMSGLTEYPHLHFTVRLAGKVVDPFAFNAPSSTCGGGNSLWQESLHPTLVYKARSVLNTGFTSGPVSFELIDSGKVPEPPTARELSPLVAFVQSLGLKAGDKQHLVLIGPAGDVLARSGQKALNRNKAQTLLFVGERAPIGGWPAGTYKAVYVVQAKEGDVLTVTFQRHM